MRQLWTPESVAHVHVVRQRKRGRPVSKAAGDDEDDEKSLADRQKEMKVRLVSHGDMGGSFGDMRGSRRCCCNHAARNPVHDGGGTTMHGTRENTCTCRCATTRARPRARPGAWAARATR